MKRYIYLYIIAVISFMMSLTSCSDEVIMFDDENVEGKIPLTFGFTVPQMAPQATRGVTDGFEDNPTGEYLENLQFYVFVFEDNGTPESNFLREIAYGSRVSVSKVDGAGAYVTVKAYVNGTNEKAIIHIVATGDTETFEAQLKSVPDRSELGLFAGAAGLYTSDKEAYWKRVELESPIVNDEGTLDIIKNKLSGLKLTRNFLRVNLRAADPDSEEDRNKYGENEIVLNGFQPDAFIITNAIDKGYVAGYNENLGANNKAGFVDFDKNGFMRDYRDLVENEKYVPERHPASVRQYPDDNASWAADFNQNGNMRAKYMFERSLQEENKTFVIVKGHYGTNATPKYFKLDIGTIFKGGENPDPNSAYGYFETFHLIRNISYDITLLKVAPNIGHNTVQGALGAPPANNVSACIETRPLERIEDGIDRMEVNNTTYVIIDDDDGDPVPSTADLKWMYQMDYYDPTGTMTYQSDQVKWNYPGFEFKFDGGVDPDGIIESWGNDAGSGNTHTPTFSPNESKDFGGNWRGFEVKFTKPDNVTRQKTIRFYKPYGLSRDVTFIMHKRWEFVNNSPDKNPNNVEVFPGAYSFLTGTMPYETIDELREALKYGSYQNGEGYVGSQRGAQMTVMFELPENLPEAIFPLDFKIGANRQNIENAYVGNAVATWGQSMFEEEDPVGVRRIQFIKTVTWEDYQQHRVVCARFLTTTDVLHDLTSETQVNENTVAVTKVKVENQYFTLGYDEFERKAHEDVIDPTRTEWVWNFSYPEWATYFSTYTDCLTDPTGWPNITTNTEVNPHNLNNLNFVGYVHGTKDDYTNVSGTFLQPRADFSGIPRDANNPEFQFKLDASSPTGMTARMTIQATPNRDRKYQGATWKYDFYFRTVYVKLITKNHPEGYTLSQNCDAPEGTKANIGTRYRLEMRTLNYDFNIEPNDVIEKVLIWSVRRAGSQPSGGGTYTYKDGETRYYSISFTAKPKP